MSVFSYIVYVVVILFFTANIFMSIVKWWRMEFIDNGFPAVLVASSLNAILFVLPAIIFHDEFSGYTVSEICLAGLPICIMLFIGNHWAVLKFVTSFISLTALSLLALRLCVSPHIPPVLHIIFPLMSFVLSMGILVWNIMSRARNLQKWLCETTVDGGIADRVNFVYLLMLLTCQMSGTLVGENMCWSLRAVSLVSMFFVMSLLQAAARRIHQRRIFLTMRTLEAEIKSAVKMYMTDMAKFIPGADVSFRAIYDRIVEYFENDQPFLDGSLTISEVSKHLLTNKVYISRAISQYSGKNFRQFVNFHRIRYAARLFQSDPHMKVSELASLAGFNSGVTFTMAFRLYMNQSPGEWCREVKASSGK